MLLFSSKDQAQKSMPYTMGVVGSAGQTESIFSGSILFDSERCFLLSNGVSVSIHGTANLFAINCLVVPTVQPLQLKAYPNPFIEKVTVTSYSVFNYTTAVMYDLHLYNAAGLRIKRFTTSIYGHRSGYEISTSFLAAGTYYLKVQVGQLHIQTLTLIKSQ
ncbi:MAG: T9SS type A sorting domain-containing protein [Sediminibacterium sp.]